ncbi:MAG: hypothetical protein FRX49_12019 [Trebouxia sp. A1-2]|nr:MAG: hypothetical protein FRX49_12019 [Trebouxia sp. A1-2]
MRSSLSDTRAFPLERRAKQSRGGLTHGRLESGVGRGGVGGQEANSQDIYHAIHPKYSCGEDSISRRGVQTGKCNSFVPELADSRVHLAAQVMGGPSKPAGWQPGPGGLQQHPAWLLAQQLPAQLPSPQTRPAAHGSARVLLVLVMLDRGGGQGGHWEQGQLHLGHSMAVQQALCPGKVKLCKYNFKQHHVLKDTSYALSVFTHLLSKVVLAGRLH